VGGVSATTKEAMRAALRAGVGLRTGEKPRLRRRWAARFVAAVGGLGGGGDMGDNVIAKLDPGAADADIENGADEDDDADDIKDDDDEDIGSEVRTIAGDSATNRDIEARSGVSNRN
jgi:hypothetical protein